MTPRVEIPYAKVLLSFGSLLREFILSKSPVASLKSRKVLIVLVYRVFRVLELVATLIAVLTSFFLSKIFILSLESMG